MNTNHRLLCLLAAAAVTAAGWVATRPAREIGPAPATIVATTAQADRAIAPATAALPAPVAAPAPGSAVAQIVYPDGSRRPALNGVAEAPKMAFPPSAPFTPIVGMVRHADRDWYRHENGALSTTLLDGAGVPIACVMTPMPRAKIVD